MPHTFETMPRGPFDLAYEREHFGWQPFAPEAAALAMAFPVEGRAAAAAVVVRQPGDRIITGTVHGCEDDVAAQAAWQQALAVLSLDVDGTDFPAVGERDPVIGRLQKQYHHMRPTLFHSPYEAACNFVIGQRISIAQARALRQRMARDHGRAIEADGATLAAFPSPDRLLDVDTASPGFLPRSWCACTDLPGPHSTGCSTATGSARSLCRWRWTSSWHCTASAPSARRGSSSTGLAWSTR